MFKLSKEEYLVPEKWGLEINDEGVLMIGDCSTVALAGQYGTPLHVVDEARLQSTARSFLQVVQGVYPGETAVHFAFKCNSVPGVVRLVQEAGLKAEVMSAYELQLALHLGFRGEEIIINGPYKTDELLEQCLDHQVRYIIIDSLTELERLDQICTKKGCKADILLRINPDVVPKGMNQGSATGSRRGCAFGLDFKGGEVGYTLGKLKKYHHLQFHGFHFHIGSGIYHPNDYLRALESLRPLIRETQKLGFEIQTFDIGGGLASATSREMTTREMLMYQAFERLPSGVSSNPDLTFEAFGQAVKRGFLSLFGSGELPELLVEPGRSITSSNQLLLLRTHQIKKRKGVKKWLITDGGIGTVAMPVYYEYHEVFLCNDVRRPRSEKVNITGPGCFASDIVYRNKNMPRVKAGEILAVMDSGAYFTAWESSFGFFRPAVAGVKGGKSRLLRRRETFQDTISRDKL